jgi:hypothetical protein
LLRWWSPRSLDQVSRRRTVITTCAATGVALLVAGVAAGIDLLAMAGIVLTVLALITWWMPYLTREK